MRSYNTNFSPGSFLTPAVKTIMTWTIGVFILQVLMTKFAPGFLMDYFALTPARVVENFWLWQLFTHGFMHDVNGLFHIFSNMITLFFFGHFVERHYGSRKFFICYFFCMVIAALVYIVNAYFNTNPLIPGLGASGATMGLLMLASKIVPNITVYVMFIFPMTLRTVVWFTIGIEFYYAWMYPSSQMSALAHLGGLGAGYLFFKYQVNAFSWMDRLEKKIERKERVQKNKKYRNMRGKVDELLDKINNDGMHSLSEKEKQFLKNASKKYREDE